MNVPAVSVIIPSYQSASTLGACLVSLTRQRGAPVHEVIVVDSSPDESVAEVCGSFPGIQLLRLPRQTDPGLARNLGARLARGPMLAFIDADCVAPPDWLRRLHARLAGGYAGVGGAIANGNAPQSVVAWAGYLCEFREFLPLGQRRAVRNLTLGNAAYRAGAFWAVGGFPVGCFPQEDQVFHQAFCSQGNVLLFDPEIVVWHRHRSVPAEYLWHQRHIGLSNARVARRLGVRGASLAGRRWLAILALPLLLPFRWTRTIAVGWPLLAGQFARQPRLFWLCWLGMVWWGRGFVEGSGPEPDRAERPAWPHTLPT